MWLHRMFKFAIRRLASLFGTLLVFNLLLGVLIDLKSEPLLLAIKNVSSRFFVIFVNLTDSNLSELLTVGLSIFEV